jgi:hypothetical protein
MTEARPRARCDFVPCAERKPYDLHLTLRVDEELKTALDAETRHREQEAGAHISRGEIVRRLLHIGLEVTRAERELRGKRGFPERSAHCNSPDDNNQQIVYSADADCHPAAGEANDRVC